MDQARCREFIASALETMVDAETKTQRIALAGSIAELINQILSAAPNTKAQVEKEAERYR